MGACPQHQKGCPEENAKSHDNAYPYQDSFGPIGFARRCISIKSPQEKHNDVYKGNQHNQHDYHPMT